MADRHLAPAAKYNRFAKKVKQLRIPLDSSSNLADTGDACEMAADGRSRALQAAEQPDGVGRPSELGALPADLRTAKGLSLREVEEATGKAVSNAYLSQLENGRIRKPSPNVLHGLADVYVPYETLMEKAGYLLPPRQGRRAPQQAGGLRDRRSHRRGGRGAAQISGVPSLPRPVIRSAREFAHVRRRDRNMAVGLLFFRQYLQA